MLDKLARQHLKKLKQKKYRNEHGEFVVEGVKGVQDALASEWLVRAIVVEKGKARDTGIEQIVNIAKERSLEILIAETRDISEIKTTETFPGVQAIVLKPDVQFTSLLDNGPIICLDHVADPGNVGTIFRTADWFGIKNILLSEECADPFNSKTVRSTMGSLFHVKLFQSNGIVKDVEQLKKKGYTIVSLSMDGEPLDTLKPAPNTVYIFGSESHGVSKELGALADQLYTIPGNGNAESLNVAVAAGIVMNQISNE